MTHALAGLQLIHLHPGRVTWALLLPAAPLPHPHPADLPQNGSDLPQVALEGRVQQARLTLPLFLSPQLSLCLLLPLASGRLPLPVHQSQEGLQRTQP